MRALAGQMVRFGVVGAVGFVIDGGLLWLLLRQGVDPYFARALSFPPAVCVGWALNRLWTFAAAERTAPRRQLPAYFAVQLAGAAANYLVYALVVARWDRGEAAALAGFTLGSAVGMFVNFAGVRMLVFRR